MNNKSEDIKKYEDLGTEQSIIETNPNHCRKYKSNETVNKMNKYMQQPNKQMDMSGNATAGEKKGNKSFLLTIENIAELENILSKVLYNSKQMTQSASKLLDCLIIKLQENGFNSNIAILPLKEYASMLGKKDIKELRKRATGDLVILRHIKITDTFCKGGEFHDIYLFGGEVALKNGQIYFKFNDTFFNVLAGNQNGGMMFLPLEALQTNEKQNPNAYLLVKKILQHKRVNAGKPNENIIGVKTLYEYCTTLPRYEDIKNNGQIDQRIMQPFERDLSVFSKFTWEYITQKKEAYTNFEEWLSLNIKVVWHNELPRAKRTHTSQSQLQKEKQQERCKKKRHNRKHIRYFDATKTTL